MRCSECGTEIDELNESQPVCPACGAPPGVGRDDEDVCALLDDAALIAADCLPRGGSVRIETSKDPAVFGFKIVAIGQGARIVADVERALRGETAEEPCDARGVQPYLTHRLAKKLNAGLTMTAREGQVELVAG